MQPVMLTPDQQCDLMDRVVPDRGTGPGSVRDAESGPMVRMTGCEAFPRIHDPGVEVAHWARRDSAPAALTVPEGGVSWKGSAEEALADPFAVLSLLPVEADRLRLCPDLGRLTEAFLAVAAGRRVQASLAAVSGQQCPKWHIDHVVVRLTCAWQGRGTEWACGAGVDLSMLGQPAPCIETANARIVSDDARVFRAGPGEVVLLRGRAHPDGVGHTVHRSPAADPQGVPRLVWTLTAWG